MWVAYPKAAKLGTDLSGEVLRKLFEPQGVRPAAKVPPESAWSPPRLRPQDAAKVKT